MTDLAILQAAVLEAMAKVPNRTLTANICSGPLKAACQAQLALLAAQGKTVAEIKPRQVLSASDVQDIRCRYGNGGKISQKQLALEYKVTQTTICSIVNWKSWQHLPDESEET